MRDLLLQRILAQISYSSLPHQWRLETPDFSTTKQLWSFQREALQQALKAIHLHLHLHKGSKHLTHQTYLHHGLKHGTLDITLKHLPTPARQIAEKHGFTSGNRIPFENIINRAGFWMATGSGKTLVLIKLADILRILISRGLIPYGNILVLTHRDDLITQLQQHLNEYNTLAWKRGYTLRLASLREYYSILDTYPRPLTQANTIFYYRSDLIGTRHGPRRIDYEDIEDQGKWYIILDEAHRGDKEESTRQLIYAILSRNRMLFNFSATLIDPRDRATTAYNFNLERLVSTGYGKHLYVHPKPLHTYRGTSTLQERIIETLQPLILLARLRQQYKRIPPKTYHAPLLVGLMHTVNKPGAPQRPHPDLQAFIHTLEHIANHPPGIKQLTRAAAHKLARQLEENPHPLYTKNTCPNHHDTRNIRETSWETILENVFNTKEPGQFEALLPVNEKREALLRVEGSQKPFALIRIGNAHTWVKKLLPGRSIHIIHSHQSLFEKINQKPHLTMLLGSRGFYEGWDSTRPNIILFINIGVGTTAHKFVVQSIGRGLRIQPTPNRRTRLTNPPDCSQGQPQLETLYVLGTSRETLVQILKSLEQEKTPPIQIVKYRSTTPVKPSIPECLIKPLRQYYTANPLTLMLKHGLTQPQLRQLQKILENPAQTINIVTGECPDKLLPTAEALAEYIKAGNNNS